MTDASHGDTAIVLVGGRGSRLGPVTANVPKPLLSVAGRPFLDWVLAVLSHAGIRRFVLAAGHRADRVEVYARARKDATVVSEDEPLGTGGAIASAAPTAGGFGPLLIANGDSLVASDQLCEIWELLEQDVDAALVAIETSEEARYGRVRVRDGFLSGFMEKEETAGPINAGIYVVRRSLATALSGIRPLSLEREVLPAWIAEGVRIRVLVLKAPFIDIGTPASLARSQRFVEQHVTRAFPL
jgi:D-glycero-alpha-D-manno-heptose 1-phosphate guanylyltransferase